MSENPHDPAETISPGRRARHLVLRLILLAAVLALVVVAAGAGWVCHRDRQVIARYAPQPMDAAQAGALALDRLLDDCDQPSGEERARILGEADLIHEDSSGDWGSGRQVVKVYRHRYLDYYVEYSIGFFPVQRRLCRIR